MKLKLNIDGTEHELAIYKRGHNVRVVRNGRETTLQVVPLPDGSYEVHHKGGRLNIAGMAEGAKRQLWLNGRVLSYEKVQKRAAGTTAVQGSLSASIPAVVSEILVAEGDEVSAGQKLILLESMKMVIPIIAPEAGVVQTLQCTVGESVQPGVPLLVVS